MSDNSTKKLCEINCSNYKEALEHLRLLIDKVVDRDHDYLDYSDGWRSRVKEAGLGSPERIITDAKDFMSGNGIPYVHTW
jgi:hypothetical protein